MSGRKIGVGFNQPLVYGVPRDGWKNRYDFSKRLTRLRPAGRNVFRRPLNTLWGISTIDTMRAYWDELKPKKGKRK